MSNLNIKQEISIPDQPIPVSIKGLKNILFQLENCICQIHKKNGGKGTGFFCKILFKNNLLPVLITNNHVLKEEDIKNDEIIELTIYNKIEKENEDISIKIDNSRIRYTNSKIDITINEIKPEEDKIKYYLEIDEEEITENNIEKVQYIYYIIQMKNMYHMV